MLMFRKYSPRFASEGEIAAQRYANKLVWPGRVVSLLLAFPLTQWLAAILGLVMGLIVYAVGVDFRRHEKALAGQTPLWRRLWLMKGGATFLGCTVVAAGVALGQTDWLGKAHAFHEVTQSAMTFVTLTEALFK
ncbi:hypothetical protein [Pseudomonas syringae]|uniref:hypothetical protein n=1 Tax=Pseudomonas syringae TaxID=317 RepID=UPI001BCB9733|nr:hypothetical protein [Pseudomonas syringae]QVI74229.1 hypothetical protein KHW13_18295 [Pseudomonas syringae]